MSKFVPDNFNPPERIRLEEFTLRKLCYTDAETDYNAVMSSIDIIRQIRGGNWPTIDMTLQENQIDLGWHQREFEFKRSFAYSVWDLTEEEYLGCIYFYPVDMPWILQVPAGSDVVVNMWVTQNAYNRGQYVKLFIVLEKWVKEFWPFKQPHFSNIEKPV